MLDAPAAAHELTREPIEQFRVGRLRTVAAEVVRSANDALAELMLLETVH